MELTVKQYADKMKISTMAVYKKIKNNQLKSSEASGRTMIILDGVNNKRFQTPTGEFETSLKQEIFSLKQIIKSYKKVSKAIKTELKKSHKVITKQERKLDKRDKLIESLLTKNETLLQQVLNESNETKEVYKQFTTYLLPPKPKKKKGKK